MVVDNNGADGSLFGWMIDPLCRISIERKVAEF